MNTRPPAPTLVRTCFRCGCTDADCRQCIARTGRPCFWVGTLDLCSACDFAIERGGRYRCVDGLVRTVADVRLGRVSYRVRTSKLYSLPRDRFFEIALERLDTPPVPDDEPADLGGDA